MDRVVPSDCIQESLGCSARSGHRGFQLIYQLLSFIGATNTCRNAIRMNEEHHVISCHLSTWFVSLAVEGKDLTWKNVEFALLQLSSQGSAQHTEKYSEDARQFESALAGEACKFMDHSDLIPKIYTSLGKNLAISCTYVVHIVDIILSNSCFMFLSS